MKYDFTKKDVELINTLGLPFNPLDNLSDDEAMMLADALSDKAGFGSEESDAFEDILQKMAEQEEEYEGR